jgi:hypothetical protein
MSSLVAAQLTNPPSITTSGPVMKLESSEAKNRANLATSSDVPARCLGVSFVSASINAVLLSRSGVNMADAMKPEAEPGLE